MPTRIRVLLQNNTGSTLVGKRAVSFLWEHVPGKEKKAIVALPSRMLRLSALMAFLPPDWVLTLVREARGIRKNRSVYWKMREQQVPKQVVVHGQNVGYRIDVVAQARAVIRREVREPVIFDLPEEEL